jgi:hypothetical protein
MALFTAPIESTEPIETGEMQVGFSDVDWTTYGDDEDDSTSTRLSERLASELRSCGMVVGIGSDDVEDDDYYDEEDDEEDDD